ncbi:hypothetical protein DC31_09010 [Microbacterium sp. CH12i]|uniref:hypothetical protein n=1 Tax=Microbacterium sp. CH12i TaxID=1479651 RepID=UPI000461AE6A|nr:hypothetical protein [Microbacterium sp. CH12i]KDA06677.1 hypothetical protein DC31_09010 [Microbacterium sp. CH12i]
MGFLKRYRSTGADALFGNPTRAHHGVAMEGYFWRITDLRRVVWSSRSAAPMKALKVHGQPSDSPRGPPVSFAPKRWMVRGPIRMASAFVVAPTDGTPPPAFEGDERIIKTLLDRAA